MTRPIDIPPPLICGACGALVDERQAWRAWPHHKPAAAGEYLVLMMAPNTAVYRDIGRWEAATWTMDDPYGYSDAWPIAWRHLPPLPEWIT